MATPRRKKSDVDSVSILSSIAAPMIFISHDTRDAELSEAFSTLLSSVSAGVLRSFRSSDRKGSQGIEYGAEWFPTLMRKLNLASDVVCLLTQRSLDRPWILYEVGVAKGSSPKTPIYGIALGIPFNRVNTGPFAQLQNSDDDLESLTGVVMQLVRRIPNAEPNPEVIGMQVRTFKQKASEILERLNNKKNEGEQEVLVDKNSVAKLFEEVKVMFDGLPTRVESKLTHKLLQGTDGIFRRTIRHKLEVYDELVRMSDELGDPIGLVILVSYFRDDLPWLYEIGLEAYRAIKTGDQKEIANIISVVQRATDYAEHHSLEQDITRHKESLRLLREFPEMIKRFLVK